MEQSSRRLLAGVNVTLSAPSNEPDGVTFLLPGAMIAIQKYNSIRDVLLKKNQIVLSFYMNVLTKEHRVMAQQVVNIFNDFQQQYSGQRFDSYSIVGHSVGAKVALLVAAHFDVERVSTVVALDPIDMNPPEFTSGNVKLSDATASLCITWATAGGAGITASNNPLAVYRTMPDAVKCFIEFEDGGHMAYADYGGGLPGLLMRSGTKEGNKRTHAGTLELVARFVA